MTPENILIPRYKVIADYPGVNADGWYLSEVIQLTSTLEGRYVLHNSVHYKTPSFFDSYPNIFKKLKWWEDRLTTEMPDYVKDVENNRIIYKVYGWLQNCSMFYFGTSETEITHTNYFVPATKEEYEAKNQN